MPAHIVGLQGPLAGQRFEVGDVTISFGRTPDNVVSIDSKSVSRHHAEIRRDASGLVLLDLGSANGTLVNRERVQSRYLQPGDVIQMGDQAFRFEYTDAPAARPVSGIGLAAPSAAHPVPVGAPPMGHAPQPPPPAAAQPSGARTWPELVAVVGVQKGKRFPLNTDSTWFGRVPENQIVVESVQASRRHAEIVRDALGYLINDRGSFNGTYVNRERVQSRYLQHGDIIHVGDEAFRFEVPGGPTISTASPSMPAPAAAAPSPSRAELAGAPPLPPFEPSPSSPAFAPASAPSPFAAAGAPPLPPFGGGAGANPFPPPAPSANPFPPPAPGANPFPPPAPGGSGAFPAPGRMTPPDRSSPFPPMPAATPAPQPFQPPRGTPPGAPSPFGGAPPAQPPGAPSAFGAPPPGGPTPFAPPPGGPPAGPGPSKGGPQLPPRIAAPPMLNNIPKTPTTPNQAPSAVVQGIIEDRNRHQSVPLLPTPGMTVQCPTCKRHIEVAYRNCPHDQTPLPHK